ncbi:hypothetical protein V1525DRAFT_451759 [Lipomyces kononenkoae]|uniref:Uncharacterized protein n=1 Tax=Lipomyces kononenkoae TaxID=34357 RepID=A0ACC3SW28_LIPKO
MLSLTSFSGQQNPRPDESVPLFYQKTAVFSPALANLFYERLWTQNGGGVLRVSGFFEDSANRCESRCGGNRRSERFHVWDQVHRYADYVFVDAETWADAPLIDGRIVPFDPSWIVSCINANRILPGTQHAFWPVKISAIRSKQHLRGRRTPLSGGVALTATEASAIQSCLHSVRENMKLLESSDKIGTSHIDDMIPGSTDMTPSAKSLKGNSPDRRSVRQNYRIAKRSPCTPTSDYFLRRGASQNGGSRRGGKLIPDAAVLSESPSKELTYLAPEVPETVGEDDMTLVADNVQIAKLKDRSVDKFQLTLEDTIFVASTSPIAIAAGKIAGVAPAEPVCDTDRVKIDPEISSMEDRSGCLPRIRS